MLDPEGRETDQEAEDERDRGADEQAKLERDAVRLQDRHGIGAEGQKRGVRERDLAGIAQGQVEADGGDDVNQDEAADEQLVLLEAQRQDQEGAEDEKRHAAPDQRSRAGHAHSSFLPQRPSGLSISTRIRMTSA